MTGRSETAVEAWLERELERDAAADARKKADAASTPQDARLSAVDSDQYEAVVARAKPAEPIAMVTPEEREAALRAAGQWKEEKPKAEAQPAPAPEPKEPERELTPNEQYIAEHCSWRKRTRSRPRNPRPGRCLTEYDVLTGEIIGDGYDPRY